MTAAKSKLATPEGPFKTVVRDHTEIPSAPRTDVAFEEIKLEGGTIVRRRTEVVA